MSANVFPGWVCPDCMGIGSGEWGECSECDGLGQIPACRRCLVAPAASSEEECRACIALPRCFCCPQIATVENALCDDCASYCPECMKPPKEPVFLADEYTAGRWCARHVGEFAAQTASRTKDDDVLARALDALDRYATAMRADLPRRLRAAGGAR